MTQINYRKFESLFIISTWSAKATNHWHGRSATNIKTTTAVRYNKEPVVAKTTTAVRYNKEPVVAKKNNSCQI